MDEDTQQPVGRARLGRTLAKGFRAAYENLGYVVLASFVWFVVTFGLVLLGWAGVRAFGLPGVVLLLPAIAIGYLLAVGVFYYANKVVYHERPVLTDTLSGIRVLLAPALSLLAVDLLITAVLVGDAVFFLTAKGPVFAALGVLCAYLTCVWLMMAMYHLPLLPAQLEMESGPRVWVILRKSYLLAADNPGFTVGVFLVIIAFAVLCVPALVGTALLFLGASAFLLTHVLRELFIKYGIVEEEPEVAGEDGWRLRDDRRRDNDDSGGVSDG